MYVAKSDNTDQISVLEEIFIDGNVEMSCAPFADIYEFSAVRDELETLLTIGSVFELESIEKNVSYFKVSNTIFILDIG